MITFLPYADFIKSAECLDWRRLGNQRSEALLLIRELETGEGKWPNHPCALMWQDHIPALKLYYNYIVKEWIGRGYKNTMPIFEIAPYCVAPPSWWRDTEVFSSHRSNLLRKDPIWYSQFHWTEPNDLPYFWPIVKEKPL